MTADDIRHFLVTYDVVAGRAEVCEFQDYETALAAYASAEREHFGDSNFDVVLLGADSLDTVKRTHSSYFETSEHGFEPFFRDLLTR